VSAAGSGNPNRGSLGSLWTIWQAVRRVRHGTRPAYFARPPSGSRYDAIPVDPVPTAPLLVIDGVGAV